MTTQTALPPLTDMVAVSGKSGIKPLGYIVWFSVPDRPVGLRHLRKVWISKALDLKVLPDEPRPLYLFKRAMRAQEGKVRHDDGTITETDVKQVLEDHQYCIYQISRVVRDAQKRVVDYPKAMRVVFDKNTVNDPLDFQPLTRETEIKDILPMQEAIESYYDENGKLIDGRKVRTVVREYIRSDPNHADEPGGTVGLRGENLRGKAGGVYFVQAKFKDDLDSLAEALNELHSDGSAYLYMVPLADGTSERELVRRHHVNNTVAEMQEAMAAAANLLRGDRKQNVRADHAAFHFRRLAALRQRAKEYTTLLGEEQEDVEVMAGMLEKQLAKLPDAVKP